MRPVPGAAEPRRFLGAPREAFRIEAALDGSGVGVLELALVVDGSGRAAGIGYTAPAGDRAVAAEAFERVAKSAVLR